MFSCRCLQFYGKEILKFISPWPSWQRKRHFLFAFILHGRRWFCLSFITRKTHHDYLARFIITSQSFQNLENAFAHGKRKLKLRLLVNLTFGWRSESLSGKRSLSKSLEYIKLYSTGHSSTLGSPYPCVATAVMTISFFKSTLIQGFAGCDALAL